MGMTWKLKVTRIAFALAVVAALAVALAADYADGFSNWLSAL
jgi:hypothetical protein